MNASQIWDIAVEYVMSPIPDVDILTVSTTLYVQSVHSETHVQSCHCQCFTCN